MTVHGVISYRTTHTIFTAVKTSDIIQFLHRLTNNCRKFNSSLLTHPSTKPVLHLFLSLVHQNWAAVPGTETVSCGVCKLGSLHLYAGN